MVSPSGSSKDDVAQDNFPVVRGYLSKTLCRNLKEASANRTDPTSNASVHSHLFEHYGNIRRAATWNHSTCNG